MSISICKFSSALFYLIFCSSYLILLLCVNTSDWASSFRFLATYNVPFTSSYRDVFSEVRSLILESNFCFNFSQDCCFSSRVERNSSYFIANYYFCLSISDFSWFSLEISSYWALILLRSSSLFSFACPSLFFRVSISSSCFFSWSSIYLSLQESYYFWLVTEESSSSRISFSWLA